MSKFYVIEIPPFEGPPCRGAVVQLTEEVNVLTVLGSFLGKLPKGQILEFASPAKEFWWVKNDCEDPDNKTAFVPQKKFLLNHKPLL